MELWIESIVGVLDKYYGVAKIICFSKAVGYLDATNILVFKTMVLSKLKTVVFWEFYILHSGPHFLNHGFACL